MRSVLKILICTWLALLIGCAPAAHAVRFRTASEFIQEHAVNLSRGGVFIRTDDPPPIDSVVEVELQLPDSGPPVTTAGIVVHRQQIAPGKIPGAGVQFVDASDAFRERIDKFMDSLLRE